MKKVVILLLIFNYSIIFANNNWQIYTNKQAGFSIKYLDNVSITVRLQGNSGSESITLFESINKKSLIDLKICIDDIETIEEAPCRYDKESALEEKNLLDKGKSGGGIDWAIDVALIKIDNIYGESFIILSRFAIDDISLERVLLFFHNNYRIIIYFDAQKLKEIAIKTMPDFFYKMENCYGNESDCCSWNTEGKSYNEFNKILKNGKGSKEIQMRYDMFDEIIDTIKIIDNKYYITKVKNLRLRENFSLDSKVIRNLNLNEKLQFIDQTHEKQNINGIEGYWIKVKTEKNEIGWCFSGYLDELK